MQQHYLGNINVVITGDQRHIPHAARAAGEDPRGQVNVAPAVQEAAQQHRHEEVSQNHRQDAGQHALDVEEVLGVAAHAYHRAAEDLGRALEPAGNVGLPRKDGGRSRSQDGEEQGSGGHAGVHADEAPHRRRTQGEEGLLRQDFPGLLGGLVVDVDRLAGGLLALFLLLEFVPALRLAAEEERVLVPGDAVIVCPGTRNRYGGDWNKSYCEDAIRFYGPVADMLRQSGILRDEVVHFGKLRRLQPIIELAGDPAIDAQINANLELQKLLVEMYNARRKSTSETEIELLLARIKARPEYWWTVEEMAELCNTSIDQLRRIFLKHTGVLPKVYVDRFKMTKAAELLLAGDLKVAEVARRFGYVDPYHFSRRFKCIMGFSPRRYRREISVLP